MTQLVNLPRGLRPQEVAVRLGLPLATTYRLINQGVIPAYRLGPRVLVVPEEELGRVLERLRVRPDAQA
jgi:excisionase family DNA binding protein